LNGVLLAELEVWHSRPITPTRRVSLGNLVLPSDPAPGFGGLLLGAVVAAHMDPVIDDLWPDIHRLIDQISRGDRVVQPRLRHRFQVDRHGMARSVHRLVGVGEDLKFEFQNNGNKLQQVLGAIYAAERLDSASRHLVAEVLHVAMRWKGPIGPEFVARLVGSRAKSFRSLADPRAWALDILGFAEGSVKPSKRDVTAHFRAQLMVVHPDHGGNELGAGSAIGDLGEARRILLAWQE
jgi:hypothetical protein